jgi:outer membrane receptor for ferrienterochelin and colicin
MKKKFLAFCLILQFTLLIKVNSGIIEGIVVDFETGSPLPGANVMIHNSAIGAAADKDGEFIIQNVPAGHYTVQVNMMGYQIKMTPDVVVEKNRSTQIIFKLREQAVKMDAIKVSGSFFDRSSDAIMSAHTLSSYDIRSVPGSAGDVFRILKNIPGVNTTGSRSANLIVRGGDINENLILLDNIEIKSPLHFSREDMSMGVISIINPLLIKNVEFLTGGFPAEYGDKLSSVFELKVKEGNRTGFNHDLNFNMAGFHAFIDGPLYENGNVLFSIRRGIFDLFTKMMGRKVQPRYWDMLGKVTYDLGTRHKLSLVGFYYKDDVERRETMNDHGYLARRYDFMNLKDFGSAVGLNWRYLYSDRGFALTTLEWTGNGNESQIGYKSDHGLNGDDILTQNIQLKTKISYKISPQFILKTGGYVKRISSDYTRWREADTLQTGFIIHPFKRVYTLPVSYQSGLFVQGSIRPFHRLLIHPGIRFDSTDLTHESYWSPRVGLSYTLSYKTTLNAAWGLYYQTPSAFAFSMDQENSSLKSSQATHTVLGLEHMLSPDTRVSIEAYYKNINNGFVYSDTSNIITNEGNGFSKGLEFTLQKKMSTNFMGSLAYTWSVSKRQDGERLPEHYFDYDRRHNLTMMIAYQLSDIWRLGVKVQYASGNPYTPVIDAVSQYGEWFVVKGEENSSRFPAYHTLDIRVDRAFRFSNWTLNMYLEVWNLLNRENVLGYYYDVDQNGLISQGVMADFPIMPMIGFSAQF